MINSNGEREESVKKGAELVGSTGVLGLEVFKRERKDKIQVRVEGEDLLNREGEPISFWEMEVPKAESDIDFDSLSFPPRSKEKGELVLLVGRYSVRFFCAECGLNVGPERFTCPRCGTDLTEEETNTGKFSWIMASYYHPRAEEYADYQFREGGVEHIENLNAEGAYKLRRRRRKCDPESLLFYNPDPVPPGLRGEEYSVPEPTPDLGSVEVPVRGAEVRTPGGRVEVWAEEREDELRVLVEGEALMEPEVASVPKEESGGKGRLALAFVYWDEQSIDSCPGCGRWLSLERDTCPKCGANISKRPFCLPSVRSKYYWPEREAYIEHYHNVNSNIGGLKTVNKTVSLRGMGRKVKRSGRHTLLYRNVGSVPRPLRGEPDATYEPSFDLPQLLNEMELLINSPSDTSEIETGNSIKYPACKSPAVRLFSLDKATINQKKWCPKVRPDNFDVLCPAKSDYRCDGCGGLVVEGGGNSPGKRVRVNLSGLSCCFGSEPHYNPRLVSTPIDEPGRAITDPANPFFIPYLLYPIDAEEASDHAVGILFWSGRGGVIAGSKADAEIAERRFLDRLKKAGLICEIAPLTQATRE